MSTITLADVAAYAKVSTATVSMVLRNRGRISDETRKRVLSAIDHLGYVYNQTAANRLAAAKQRQRHGAVCRPTNAEPVF